MEVGILTVSDTCYLQEKEDTSGKNLMLLLESRKLVTANIRKYQIVPDEIPNIKEALIHWCDSLELDVIFTIGGTGFSQRDVTPEAVKAVIDKEAPGISVRMISQSLVVTPLAMLSRPLCGIRGKTVIITFPGSRKASQECLGFIAPGLKHAVELLKDCHLDVQKTHSELDEPSKLKDSCKCQDEDISSQAEIGDITKRNRVSPYPLVSVEEAQKIVLTEAFKLPSKRIKASESHGFTAAEDIRAHMNLPPFPASIKDGYAVVASDGAGRRMVIGASTAGASESDLSSVVSGRCMRINTGAPLPPGADAVVQVEDTELITSAVDGSEELEIEILKAPELGQDIRSEGSDIHIHELLIEEGTPIGPPEMGVMASGGTEFVDVYNKPVVALLSTGNEIQDANQFPLQKDHIYDSNKVTIKCLLEKHNFQVFDVGIATDTTGALMECIRNAFRSADVLVTTGGVSMGEKDLLRPVLISDFHATIHFARVFMKPGKPTTFATCKFEGRKKLILGLPGNPVSATVTSYIYLLPLCRKMSGMSLYNNLIIKVKLDKDVKLDTRPEYQRVFLDWNTADGIPVAYSTGNQISSRLLSVSHAQALLKLPASTEAKPMIPKDSLIDALLMTA